MSVYHKPQTPIKSGEKYIYPLTTVDQVLVEDGSRLNAKYITVDINDTEMGTIPITNANQLGGLDASQYATKAHVASEYITKEYIDNLLDGTVINLVEKYGITPILNPDDELEQPEYECSALINQAIQDATEEGKKTSGDTLYLPPGRYYTTGTIIVNKSVNLKFDGSIEYRGTDYAIEFSNYNYCKAEINRIRTSTGSCIKLSSDSTVGNGHITYSTFKFNRLSANSNNGYCIYAETKGNGYINVNKFIGGNCLDGYTAFKINNTDSYVYAFGNNTFESIALEGGFDTGFHFTNYCTNNLLLNCNLEESGDGYLKSIVTEGYNKGLKIIGNSMIYRSYMELSSETSGMAIGTMRDKVGNLIDTYARIVRGELVLEKQDRTKILSNTGEYDMATTAVYYEDDGERLNYSEIGLIQFNNEYNNFVVAESCTGIRLSKKYGHVNGINDFTIVFNKNTSGDFTIKDYEGNRIDYIPPCKAGIISRFKWSLTETGESGWTYTYEFPNMDEIKNCYISDSFPLITTTNNIINSGKKAKISSLKTSFAIPSNGLYKGSIDIYVNDTPYVFILPENAHEGEYDVCTGAITYRIYDKSTINDFIGEMTIEDFVADIEMGINSSGIKYINIPSTLVSSSSNIWASNLYSVGETIANKTIRPRSSGIYIYDNDFSFTAEDLDNENFDKTNCLKNIIKYNLQKLECFYDTKSSDIITSVPAGNIILESGENIITIEEGQGTINEITYYNTITNPVNLLDNSNFVNPVNQRNQTTYDTDGYTIDRWMIEGSTCQVIENSSVLIEDEGYLVQRIPAYIMDESKTYTLAALNTAGNVLVGENAGFVLLDDGTYGFNTIKLLPGEYVWAALYEGSYTADTLPPYVPKGYGAELAECLRYFRYQPSFKTIARGLDTTRIEVMLEFSEAPMRIAPSVVTSTERGFIDGVWSLATKVTVAKSSASYVELELKFSKDITANAIYLAALSLSLNADI